MQRAIASVVLVALLLLAVAPAHAGRSTDIALGLASFAVFNQVVGPFLRPRAAEASYHRREVVHQTVVTQPAVVYTTPAPVVAAPVVATPVVVATAPVVSYPTVVQYPHGRYELRWNGAQYTWVWIPNVPPVPPPPPATTAPAPPPPTAP